MSHSRPSKSNQLESGRVKLREREASGVKAPCPYNRATFPNEKNGAKNFGTRCLPQGKGKCRYTTGKTTCETRSQRETSWETPPPHETPSKSSVENGSPNPGLTLTYPTGPHCQNHGTTLLRRSLRRNMVKRWSTHPRGLQLGQNAAATRNPCLLATWMKQLLSHNPAKPKKKTRRNTTSSNSSPKLIWRLQVALRSSSASRGWWAPCSSAPEAAIRSCDSLPRSLSSANLRWCDPSSLYGERLAAGWSAARVSFSKRNTQHYKLLVSSWWRPNVSL